MSQHRPQSRIKLCVFLGVIIALLALNYSSFSYKHFLPGIALVLGIILTALQKDEGISHQSKLYSSQVLSYAIIFLGFGFNLTNILKAGAEGIGYTIVSIGGTLILGLIIGKLLNNAGKISTLISSGTAICGGSAIAAIAPVIRASHEETAVAMGAVFLLNAVGLIVFPIVGHHLGLDQTQFGLLAALAIHDTSSVVGSCLAYGPHALMVGTTIKLVRALWIIPVSLIIAVIYSRQKHEEVHTNQKTKKPWFILWFVLASLSVTIFPVLIPLGIHLKEFGEALFIVALFLIGYNVSFGAIKKVGARVLFQAISLWVIVSALVIAALETHLLH
jgi:uncharacterized integral membrane protein (TIGR00698 family)